VTLEGGVALGSSDSEMYRDGFLGVPGALGNDVTACDGVRRVSDGFLRWDLSVFLVFFDAFGDVSVELLGTL